MLGSFVLLKPSPKLVISGQTAKGALVTIIINDKIVSTTLSNQETGTFKKEIYDVVEGDNTLIIYSEKDGFKSSDKVLIVNIPSTVGDVDVLNISLEIASQSYQLPGPCMPSPDLNKDGTTNLKDLSILLSYYRSGYDCRADLNRDGKINMSDFSIFLAHWLK